MACAPPLQVQLHVLPGADAGPRGGKAMAPQLLVVLRYTANPQAPGALLDVVADVSLPPQVGALAKVRWQGGQRCVGAKRGRSVAAELYKPLFGASMQGSTLGQSPVA